MTDVSQVVGALALVVAVIGTLIAGYGNYQMGRVGNRLEQEIVAVGKVTLEAIEKNGEETRKTIADVHRSIKEQLGKA